YCAPATVVAKGYWYFDV
nr:immunoglobulin heavy chain junction region [Mus musculus]